VTLDLLDANVVQEMHPNGNAQMRAWWPALAIISCG
jgi:hypothetical protein